jgi:FixJ family two-component response regulator
MTPVVVLTRLSDVATAVRAIRDSVSDYLLKPYVERDLINRVQKALLKQHEARH